MRRGLVLLVAALLVMPGAVMAQEATPNRTVLLDYLPFADDLGDGWITDFRGPGSTQGMSDSIAVGQYFGDNGAAILISVFDLPLPFQQRANEWERLTGYWQAYADFYTGSDLANDGTADPSELSNTPFPTGVESALRSNGHTKIIYQDVCIGLYALENGPAILVLIQSSYRGMSQVAACDTVARSVSIGDW